MLPSNVGYLDVWHINLLNDGLIPLSHWACHENYNSLIYAFSIKLRS
jgi:hypothetical protein